MGGETEFRFFRGSPASARQGRVRCSPIVQFEGLDRPVKGTEKGEHSRCAQRPRRWGARGENKRQAQTFERSTAEHRPPSSPRALDCFSTFSRRRTQGPGDEGLDSKGHFDFRAKKKGLGEEGKTKRRWSVSVLLK